MDTLSGKESNQCYFCFPFQLRSTLKAKNLLLKGQILCFQRRPLLELFRH